MEVVQDAPVDSVSRTLNIAFYRSLELINSTEAHVWFSITYAARQASMRDKMLTIKLQATSLPLLLLESLGNTGTLKQLMRDGETIDEVLNRGRVSAVC